MPQARAVRADKKMFSIVVQKFSLKAASVKLGLNIQAKTLTLAALLGVVWMSSCNEGSEVASRDKTGILKKTTSTKKSKPKSESSNSGDSSGDIGENTVNLDDANAEDGDDAQGGSIGTAANAAGTPAAPIDYPTMDLKGLGVTSCDGKAYQTGARFTSALDPVQLNLNLYAAHISADQDKVEKKANDKISQSIGKTTWIRTSKAEADQLKAQGFDYANYAIFAKSVTKVRQGQVFNFDKPLPVFPWPAPASRYDELVKAGTKSWTAHVSGAMNSDVTVTLQRVSASGDEQVIKFTTTIAADTNRALYEKFPMPREATFVVNGKTQDVRQITELHWYLGDENCNNGPETVRMTYKLCKKTNKAGVTPYPCE